MFEKFKSRKFQVWLVWSILAVATLWVKDLPKETVYQFYGLVSLMYIGGNVAQDFIIKQPKA